MLSKFHLTNEKVFIGGDIPVSRSSEIFYNGYFFLFEFYINLYQTIRFTWMSYIGLVAENC